MSFGRFFIVRLGWALLALWLFATLVFVMFFIALGDPARAAAGGERARPGGIEQVRKELHLDASLPEQYGSFLWRLVAHQSAGTSVMVQPPVDSGEIAQRALPVTASLVFFGLLFALGLSAAAGIGLAHVRWRRIYNLPIYIAVGLAPIFLGLLLSYYFGARLKVAPILGYCDLVSPNPDLGCGGARDWLSHLILPAITLGLFFAGVYTRIVRAGVAQVLGEQKAELRRKLSRRFVLVMARIVGRDIGFVLGVAFLVEVIFVIPGLGRSALIFAVDQYDSITLQAIILYTTGLAIAVHFVIDVIVAALDPDLRAEWPIAGMPKPT